MQKLKWKMVVRELYICPSKLGERLGWQWLMYNPGVFLEFECVARRNAPIFCDALRKAYPNLKSACDVGCGTGRYSAELQSSSIQIVAYEYTPLARKWAKRRGVDVRPFDVSASTNPGLVSKTDLAFSLEVAEHVPEAFAGNFVKFMTECSEHIVFTAAAVGQGGVGHVNCQPKNYWVGLFSEYGYSLDSDQQVILERYLRADTRLSGFLISNLLVFTKTGKCG